MHRVIPPHKLITAMLLAGVVSGIILLVSCVVTLQRLNDQRLQAAEAEIRARELVDQTQRFRSSIESIALRPERQDWEQVGGQAERERDQLREALQFVDCGQQHRPDDCQCQKLYESLDEIVLEIQGLGRSSKVLRGDLQVLKQQFCVARDALLRIRTAAESVEGRYRLNGSISPGDENHRNIQTIVVECSDALHYMERTQAASHVSELLRLREGAYRPLLMRLELSLRRLAELEDAKGIATIDDFAKLRQAVFDHSQSPDLFFHSDCDSIFCLRFKVIENQKQIAASQERLSGLLTQVSTKVANRLVTLSGDDSQRAGKMGNPLQSAIWTMVVLGVMLCVTFVGLAVAVRSLLIRTFETIEEKRLEAEKLALVAKYTVNSVAITDEKIRVEWVNEAFTRNTGYTLDEVVGSSPGKFLQGPLTDPKIIRRMRAALRKDLGFRTRVLNYKKDGTPYWNDLEVRPIRDQNGEVTKYISIQTNVTSQVEAEQRQAKLQQELKQQKTLLDTIVQHIPAGVIAAGPDGNVTCFNAKAEKLLGASRDDLKRVDQVDAIWHFQEDDGNVESEFQSPLGRAVNGEDIPNRQIRVQVGGDDRWLLLGAVAFDSEHVSGGVVIFNDVTEQVATEHGQRQSQKLEAIGQLAAGIAHEINTPMQYIGDNIDSLAEWMDEFGRFLEQTTDGGDDDDVDRRDSTDLPAQRIQRLQQMVAEALQDCREGFDQVTGITRAMKELSHPGEATYQWADLNRLVVGAITLSKNRYKYHAELVKDLEADLPEIQCRSAEISQVVLNLVVNASDAISERLESDDSHSGVIRVETRRQDDQVILRVSDNGSGMDQATIERIFDPFFTTKDVGKGTGQGLTISYDIVVAKHQGTLLVDSEPGVGTTFTVALPIERENDGESEAYSRDLGDPDIWLDEDPNVLDSLDDADDLIIT
ncbi:PAS domain-containing sensor histidine kinase [Crateriforma conspicua]|uniref:PAS domain-containing sensor histidine kinase n=1 Tax=Crateriforma conspicua TaxID=2527996 RepID=UPI0011881426|nr:PAS domain-containing protein [Crateriforma conspicua]QDV64532.1 Sporulation kinase E [Crateriforma conspicua]